MVPTITFNFFYVTLSELNVRLSDPEASGEAFFYHFIKGIVSGYLYNSPFDAFIEA